MKRLVLIPFILLLEAQAPAPESVTVTGTKEAEAARGFVDSVATTTAMVGKIARWEVPICPYTVGVQPAAAQFVTDRLKKIAAEVGAPVSRDGKCAFNIEIVFTKTPQALLDDMKQNQPGLLGYQTSSEEMDRLATFRRPIEARYTTATQDLRGKIDVDASDSLNPGQGLTVLMPCGMLGRKFEPPGKICSRTLPGVRKFDVTGAKLGSGLRSNFHHIVIVIDPRQVAGQELDTISDYVSLLALSQLSSLDACQALPSIVNALGDCANRAMRLSPADMGYLRGLYAMRSDLELVVQKNEIVTQVQQSLTGTEP